MPRTTRSTAAGRQLAIHVPLDAWTLVCLPITADQDGDQMDLLELATELESSSL